MSDGDILRDVRPGSVDGQEVGFAGAARERLLLAAVLEEALTCYRRYVLSSDEHGRALFEETEAWFQSTDRTSVFAFESICDALDLEPAYVRRGLRQWRERAGSLPPQRPARRAEPHAADRPRTVGARRRRRPAAQTRARGGRR
jgi:transposase-like protein